MLKFIIKEGLYENDYRSENMKSQSSTMFGNAYELLLNSLEHYYLSKSDGKERIKHELENWDKEAKLHILSILAERFKLEEDDFDPNDLLGLI